MHSLQSMKKLYIIFEYTAICFSMQTSKITNVENVFQGVRKFRRIAIIVMCFKALFDLIYLWYLYQWLHTLFVLKK